VIVEPQPHTRWRYAIASWSWSTGGAVAQGMHDELRRTSVLYRQRAAQLAEPVAESAGPVDRQVG
jgi:hypothetical protein